MLCESGLGFKSSLCPLVKIHNYAGIVKLTRSPAHLLLVSSYCCHLPSKTENKWPNICSVRRATTYAVVDSSSRTCMYVFAHTAYTSKQANTKSHKSLFCCLVIGQRRFCNTHDQLFISKELINSLIQQVYNKYEQLQNYRFSMIHFDWFLTKSAADT